MAKRLDRKGEKIVLGAHVIWYDPQEEYRDLERVYIVDGFKGDIVLISDDWSEAEVNPCELEVISQY